MGGARLGGGGDDGAVGNEGAVGGVAVEADVEGVAVEAVAAAVAVEGVAVDVAVEALLSKVPLTKADAKCSGRSISCILPYLRCKWNAWYCEAFSKP